MIKNKLLFRIMSWRFDRCAYLVEKEWELSNKATDHETRMKHLRKAGKLIAERRWLLDHMYPAYK